MTEVQVFGSTGVSGLDLILAGGLHRRALTLIIGAPGAGKTVLASQIIFAAAQRGMQSLIFTSYSEGNEQYIEHMGAFDFFDQSLLGNKVQIFSLQSQVPSDETSPATALTRIIRSAGAQIVLIDGFQGMAPLFEKEEHVRLFLATLSTQLRYMNVTLLLTLAGHSRDTALHAGLTVMDIIIGLDYGVQGRRHQRLLDVVKQRGQAQLPGLHSYTIDASGLRVFPRIEVYPKPTAQSQADTRAAFGLAELDRILGGGPNSGTSMLLAGAPSVGKTTLGLYWGLNQARPDARTLVVTFSEFPEQLQRKAAAFGLDLQGAITSGAVQVIRFAASELDVDRLASMVLAEIATGTVRRFICDDIAVLIHELGDRTRDFFSALNDILYGHTITSLYMLEIPAFDGLGVNLTGSPLALLGDTIVVVQQYEIEGVLRRILAVLRMKLSFFDRTLHELVLDEEGIRVAPLEARLIRSLESGTRLNRGKTYEQGEPPLEEIG